MASKIPLHALAVLHEQGLDRIAWGDPALEAIARRAGVRAPHPTQAKRSVFAALNRASTYFDKEFIQVADSRGRMRRVRRFIVRCIN